jgi:hypothetical protein
MVRSSVVIASDRLMALNVSPVCVGKGRQPLQDRR